MDLMSAVKQNMIFSHVQQYTTCMQDGHWHEDHVGDLGCGMAGEDISGAFALDKY